MTPVFANLFNVSTNGQVTRIAFVDQNPRDLNQKTEVAEIILSASDALELAKVIESTAAKNAAMVAGKTGLS